MRGMTLKPFGSVQIGVVKITSTLYMAKIGMGTTSVGYTTTDRHGRNALDDSKEVINIVVKHFGFVDMDEYMRAYPGSFHAIWSSFGSIRYTTSRSKVLTQEQGVFLTNYCQVSYIHKRHFDDNIADQVRDFNTHVKVMASLGIFILPLKMEEVRKCLGFIKVLKDNMWFCSDWKG